MGVFSNSIKFSQSQFPYNGWGSLYKNKVYTNENNKTGKGKLGVDKAEPSRRMNKKLQKESWFTSENLHRSQLLYMALNFHGDHKRTKQQATAPCPLIPGDTYSLAVIKTFLLKSWCMCALVRIKE
jgi:hypothetical protein